MPNSPSSMRCCAHGKSPYPCVEKLIFSHIQKCDRPLRSSRQFISLQRAVCWLLHWDVHVLDVIRQILVNFSTEDMKKRKAFLMSFCIITILQPLLKHEIPYSIFITRYRHERSLSLSSMCSKGAISFHQKMDQSIHWNLPPCRNSSID